MKELAFFVSILAMILNTVQGCTRTSTSSDSTTNAIGGGIDLNNVGPYQPGDPEIFVFYVNETSPSGANLHNFNNIIGTLKSQNETVQLGISYEKEKSEFRNVVVSEVEQIQRGLCQGQAKVRTVLIFRNEMMRQGRYEVCVNGQAPQVKSVENQAGFSSILNQIDHDPIYNGHPLLHRDMFQWALNEAKSYITAGDEEKTLFSLVIKSHGIKSHGQIVGPKLGINWESLGSTDDERRQRVHQAGIVSAKNAENFSKKYCTKSLAVKIGLGEIDGPSGLGEIDGPSGLGEIDGPSGLGEIDGPSGLGEIDGPSGLGDIEKHPSLGEPEYRGMGAGDQRQSMGGLSSLAQKNVGMTSQDFLDILTASGLRFLTVFTESCDSDWHQVLQGYGQKSALKLGKIFGAHKGQGLESIVSYENIKYEQFLSTITPASTFGDQLANRLSQVHVEQVQHLRAHMSQCQSGQ